MVVSLVAATPMAMTLGGVLVVIRVGLLLLLMVGVSVFFMTLVGFPGGFMPFIVAVILLRVPVRMLFLFRFIVVASPLSGMFVTFVSQYPPGR